VAELTGRITGLRRAVIQAIILAVCLEIFAVISPLFNQFVIDDVISSGDRQLLKILVLAFGLLLVTQTGIALARSWFLMRWSLDIGMQWTLRLFSHLIRLPISYFEKRHLGDITSRFGSLGAIQSTLSSLFIESLLDGLMAALSLIMMFLYSPLLSCIVLASLSFYGLLRWAFFAPIQEATVERLVLASKENSAFLETIRAIMPLKLYGREAERLARWQNLKQQVVNRDIRTQRLEVIFKSLNTAIGGAQSLMMFYMGAELIMRNQMTVGMLSAFASYAGTFSGRVFSLIDLCVNVRMMKVHTVRIADIVTEQTESDALLETDTAHISPSISLRNITFRYGDGEPWILRSVNLDIPAGQSVAIVGPSGCGKTTLCKIILGLIQPTEGEVLVGGHPIKQLGAQAYRRMIGTVMQEDVLLTGSIHDNITFFDVRPDNEFAEECARLAAVHDEIVAMPMGYRTLVGDMGSSLSGGQKQRILLARALYKRPRVLVLDEATSHLDIFNENKVSSALRKLAITRILVAHRPETINSAQRIIHLQEADSVPGKGCTLYDSALQTKLDN
jgi:ATP-binding cassette subfamily B protein RaxB